MLKGLKNEKKVDFVKHEKHFGLGVIYFCVYLSIIDQNNLFQHLSYDSIKMSDCCEMPVTLVDTVCKFSCAGCDATLSRLTGIYLN